MNFSDQLNCYLTRLGSTAKELAEASAISPAMLSRLRSGERVPPADDAVLCKLATGISVLATEKGIPDLPEETVAAALRAVTDVKPSRSDRLKDNLNALIGLLDINVNALAKFSNYDASFFSRIRRGQRTPADPAELSRKVAAFVVRTYTRQTDKEMIAGLTGQPVDAFSDEAACTHAIEEWLCTGCSAETDSISAFLQKLDEFNLDAYIRAIHFDEMKVPSVPFQFPLSKCYYGLEEMKISEIDFLKAAVLSRSAEPVIMYSDMPLEEMSKDLDFAKKWMFGMAMMLRKGLHLHMIHQVDRPFEEMMLGLESWIPMYMTGQVSPYYLKDSSRGAFGHLIKTAGSVALSGECITGAHEKGRYYLTKNKEEVAYYKNRSAALLKKAKPLMEIFRQESETVYQTFLQADARTTGARHSILSALPLYTATDAFLRSLLTRNGIPEDEQVTILTHAAAERKRIETILEKNPIQDEGSSLTREEFEQFPMSLSLSGLFYGKDISYTFAEYQTHLALTEAFAETHPRYSVSVTSRPSFRNIQITIHEGQWAMISKNKAPVIHFLVRHPNMRAAIENMMIPVIE